MLFAELILFTAAGCGCGIITGLVPGIHINTVAAFVLALLPVLAVFEPVSVAALLIAMSVTHTFLDFIPSTLFGAPDGETALSVLPGHRMLLEGRAIEAIKITGLGSLVSLLITAALFGLMVGAVPQIYSALKPRLHYLLLLIVLMSLAGEKKVIAAAAVFLLAGMFGFVVLGSGLFRSNMLFPALSGLFGVSTLYLSTREKSILPTQVIAKADIGWFKVLKNSFLGAVAGMVVGVLPGIGAAQATYITQQLTRGGSVKEFLVAVSGVNTSNIIFTLVVFYTIGKMRSGLVIAVNEVLPRFTPQVLLVFLGVVLLSGGIAMLLHMNIGTALAKWLGSRNPQQYSRISWAIIALIVGMVFVLCGALGIAVLVVGFAIGLIPPLAGVRRAECMGFFLFPVMLFYFGASGMCYSFLGVR